jgi:hypothetical protein
MFHLPIVGQMILLTRVRARYAARRLLGSFIAWDSFQYADLLS